MPQSPHRCQHISLTRRPRSRRFGTFSVSVVVALLVSCLGCWQEVRYDPGESAEPISKPVVESVEPPSPPASETLFGTSETEEEEAVEVVPVPVAVGEGAADPPAEASSPGVDRSALAAWRMGSDWSMAAALQAKGRDVASYGERLDRARDDSRLLGVELPDLPLHEEDADRLSENLVFLLEEAGPRLAGELGELHGADHAALVELATKTHILLLSYTPSSTRLEPVIVAIRQTAKSSGLPESVWGELVDLLAARAEFKQVKAAVFQLHLRAVDFLSK